MLVCSDLKFYSLVFSFFRYNLIIFIDTGYQGLKSIGSMATLLPGRKLTERKVGRKSMAQRFRKRLLPDYPEC